MNSNVMDNQNRVIKIVVVGNSKVGKSSLLLRYYDNDFR